MRPHPRSLASRLVLTAAVMIALALVAAGAGISLVLHHFVIGQIDQRLDLQIAAVAAALKPQGDGLALAQPVDGPPFDRPRSGWYWLVRDAAGKTLLKSSSLEEDSLEIDEPHYRWQEFWNFRPRPADGMGPRHQPLHVRIAAAFAGDRPVSVIATAPPEALLRPMMQALAPVMISLVVLGVCLSLATLVQVRLGLKPLAALRGAVAEVRAGRATRVPDEQPAELQPLAGELNALLDQNAGVLERARRNVANLAHALKTPLATLSLALERPERGGDAALRDEVARMERHIRHHLGRARAAALGGPARVRSALKPHVEDLAAMLAKVHAERGIGFVSTVDAGVAVACEPQDLDEMLGNTLDNAFKWARSRVVVSALAADGRVRLAIEDDGAGLPQEQVPDALRPGRRLEEATPGDGFGLAIARELAELYSGGIALDRSPLGGLRVTLELPASG